VVDTTKVAATVIDPVVVDVVDLDIRWRFHDGTVHVLDASVTTVPDAPRCVA
jgi:hypothetical protein